MVLKRVIVVLACALFAAAALSAAPRVVRTNLLADPDPIDPCTNWTYEVTHNCWVTLVGYDYAKNEVTPRGAVSWTVSADGLVWTFKIRPNWKWSDGQPVTAKDYEYTFQQIVDPANAAPQATFLFPIKNGEAINQGKMAPTELGAKALDASTFQITLTAPASYFLSSLASFGQATPRWAREKWGKDWVRPEHIVVNGPYKISKWVTDSEVDLVKNPSYWDAANVQVDQMILYIVASESTALAMYEKGELDTTWNVPATDLDRVRADSVLSKEFKTFPQQRMTSFRFYVASAPFDNPNVRKAFAMAIDRNALVTTVTRGGEIPAFTFTPPGCVGYIEPSAGIGIKFDAKGAQKLLADAGFPGGNGLPPIVYGYNATETNARIAQALQKMWKDNLGVDVTLKGVEGGGYTEMMTTGVANMFRQGWGMDYADANNMWANLFTSDTTMKGTLMSPDVDNLVKQAGTISDTAKRKALYAQIEKLYDQDLVGAVPLFYAAVNVMVKPYVTRPVEPTTLQYWTWKTSK